VLHPSTKTITVSRFLVSDDHVRGVILHEIAHALAPPKCGHGEEWKIIAQRIGASPERCAETDVKVIEWDPVICENAVKRIRSAIVAGERAQLTIAKELFALSTEGGMTQAEIATLCADEGFVTLARNTISQLIAYASAVDQLPVVATATIPEYTLRPLSAALNRPHDPMPIEQATAVAEAIAADPHPTAAKVEHLVRSTPWGDIPVVKRSTTPRSPAPRTDADLLEIIATGTGAVSAAERFLKYVKRLSDLTDQERQQFADSCDAVLSAWETTQTELRRLIQRPAIGTGAGSICQCRD
jgi:hypothetical protein